MIINYGDCHILDASFTAFEAVGECICFNKVILKVGFEKVDKSRLDLCWSNLYICKASYKVVQTDLWCLFD